MKLSERAMEEINELIDTIDTCAINNGGMLDFIIQPLLYIHGYLAIIDAEGDMEVRDEIQNTF
jgi:hypothetical protein